MSGVRSDIGLYARVPEWLLYSGVSANSIRLFAILDRHDGEGGAYPSRAVISKYMGDVSIRTVDRSLKELEDLGAVSVDPGSNDEEQQSSNLYHLHFRSQVSPALPTSVAVGATPESPRGRHQSRPNQSPLTKAPLTNSEEQVLPRGRARRNTEITEELRASLRSQFPDVNEYREYERATTWPGYSAKVDKARFYKNWIWRAAGNDRKGNNNGAHITRRRSERDDSWKDGIPNLISD